MTRTNQDASRDAKRHEQEEARQEQEEAREFLLRSLDDLDAERAAGNIDDATYQRLHDDYTARAAITVRALRDGKPDRRTDADGPPQTRRHRVLVVAGLIVFALVAATTMAFALGARLPGDTITGNSQTRDDVSAADRRRALETAVKNRPDDAQARLALARFRLGRRDLPGALEDFRVAATLQPTNAEPFAYSGWIIRLQGYPDQGLQLLDKAVAVDPKYPDAHFFRGFVLLRDMKNAKAAVPEFQQYLVAAPDSPLAEQVRDLLAEAVGSGK